MIKLKDVLDQVFWETDSEISMQQVEGTQKQDLHKSKGSRTGQVRNQPVRWLQQASAKASGARQLG